MLGHGSMASRFCLSTTPSSTRRRSLSPVGLRSLDAVHLATALSVREEIGVFLTYDKRLADAATDLGLNVAKPI